MRYKLTTADRLVGILAVVAVAGGIVVTVLVGTTYGWFKRPLVLKTSFVEAPGLSKGAPVKMCDYPIGRVTRVVFNERNEFDAEFEIFPEFASRVRETSYVQFTTDSLFNAMLVIRDFEFDKDLKVNVDENHLTRWAVAQVERLRKKLETAKRPQFERLTSGDFVAPVAKTALTDMAMQAISAFQKKLDPVAERMTKSAEHFEGIIGNLNSIITTLDEGQGVVGKFLKDEEMGNDIKGIIADAKKMTGEVAQQLPKVVKEGEGAVRNLKDLLAELKAVGEKIPALLDQVNNSVKRLDALQANLTRTTAALPKVVGNVELITRDIATGTAHLPELTQSVQTTLNNVNEILAGLKRSFLLRGFIQQEQKRSLVIQQGRHSRYEKLVAP